MRDTYTATARCVNHCMASCLLLQCQHRVEQEDDDQRQLHAAEEADAVAHYNSRKNKPWS